MKKYLIVMLLFATAAFAGTITDSDGNTAYEIIVKNSVLVDLYHEIYNIIAMIKQSLDYNNFLKLCMLIAATYIFFKASVSKVKTAPIELAKYLVFATAVLTLFYSNESKVIVKTDNLMENYSYNGTIATMHSTGTVIDNMPQVLGFGFSLLHEARSELTDIVRKAFSTNSYNNDIYAADTTGATKLLNLEMSEMDGNLGVVFKAYLEDCINIPLSGDSSVTAEEFKYNLEHSDKIFDFLADNQDTVILNLPIKQRFVSINGGTYTCENIFTRLMTNEVPQAKASVPDVLNNVGKGAVTILTGVANPPISTFEELAIQAGAANMIRKSKDNLANDNALNYAEGKSLAKFIQGAEATFHYTATMLPVVEEVLLLVLEAFAVIMIAMLFLPNGWAALGSYFTALVWVISWTPISYIVTYITNYLTGNSIASLNTPLTVASGDMYLSTSSLYSGVSAFLITLVPAISWGILNKSYQALGAISSVMSSKMTEAMETGAGARDRELINKQKLTSEKVGKKLSMADIAAIEADQNSWNDSARISAVHDLGQNKTMNKVELDTRSATEAAAKKLAVNDNNMNKTVDIESFFEEKNFNEKKGYHDLTNGDASNGLAVGQDKALQDNATKVNLETNGAEKVGKVAVNERLEKTETADTRYKEIEKTGNSVQEFAENKAKVDFNTVENPKANSLDLDGDGKTSQKELDKGAKVAGTQEKLDFYSKDRNQQELKKEAADYRKSNSARIKNAMNGTPAALGEIGQSVAAKIAADSEVSTFNNRKEVKKVENFNGQNVAPEKLASTESAEEMQKVMKVDSEAKTLQQNMGEIIGQHKELRQELAEDFMNKGMSKNEANKMAGKVMLGALADLGIADKDLTLGEIANDFENINRKEHNALNALVNGKIGTNERGKLEFLKYSEKMLAQQEPGSKGEEIWKNNVAKARENATVSQNQVNDILNSSEAKEITKKFENERIETVAQYGDLARINENGEVEAADTMATLNNPNISENEKLFKIKQINGGLQGNSVTFNDLKGMERKVVVDINGNRITDMSRAEQAYVKTGNFEHGVMYEAGKSDIMSKENLAIGATAVNYTTKVFGTRFVQDKLLGR